MPVEFDPSFNLPTLITVGGTLLAVAGAFWKLSGKVDRLEETVKNNTQRINDIQDNVNAKVDNIWEKHEKRIEKVWAEFERDLDKLSRDVERELNDRTNVIKAIADDKNSLLIAIRAENKILDEKFANLMVVLARDYLATASLKDHLAPLSQGIENILRRIINGGSKH